MPVTITDAALDVLKRSLALSKAPAVRIRVAGGAVRPQFVEAPQPGDVTVEAGGVTVHVDQRLGPDAVIDLSSEHEQLIVR